MKREWFIIKENPFKDWNFQKHLCFVATVYTAVFSVSNFFCFVRTSIKEQKKIADMKFYPKSSKKIRVFSKYDILPAKTRRSIRRGARRDFLKRYATCPPHEFKILNTLLAICCVLDVSAYPLLKKTLEKIDKMV